MMSMIVLPVAAQLAFGVAAANPQQPPNFDVKPSCRAAADASGGHDRMDGCLASEQTAHDQLVKQWTQFPAASRTLCIQSASGGGEPTYTELLTCLEMDRDSKLKPADQKIGPEPIGTGMKSAIDRAKGH
jgi:hypothetical protein